MFIGDTIAALSSATGAAARMIVRASGPEAWALARAVIVDPAHRDAPVSLSDAVAARPDAPIAPIASIAPPVTSAALGEAPLAHAQARQVRLLIDGLNFPAWVYAFRAPNSFSGEDLIELHLPGNPLLARMTLDSLLRRGARLAEAGEFTARAYFNRRIDLTRAEGVAASIAAQSEAELRGARQLLSGELARRLTPVMNQLAQTLALIEVAIDFSDEDVTFLSADQAREAIDGVIAAIDGIVRNSARFERLAHEPRVALIGRPNAGKSTLLNALAGMNRAVVSEVAGTTRDAIWAHVELARGRIQLVDVAGLEDDAASAADSTGGRAAAADEVASAGARSVAASMRAHALRELRQADLVLLIHDATDDRPPLDLPRTPNAIVLTKLDLRSPHAADGKLAVSATTGAGIPALRDQLDGLAFGAAAAGAELALNARHLAALDEALGALRRAVAQTGASARSGAELAAADLREALEALGRILGGLSPDDLLGMIFSRFCIGK